MSSLLNPDATSGDLIDKEDMAAEPSDRGLLLLIAEGDEPAFASLYRRHNLAIFNYLLRMVHEKPVAEDLLQEVFVAVWEGSDRFKGRAKVKTWIFRIAHNQAVSWLRKNGRRKLDYEMAELRTPDGPEARSLANWQHGQVQEALGQLSAVHRAVIELAFVNELSYADISEVMDCPVGTVKSRMSYALRHLEQLLKWRGIDE